MKTSRGAFLFALVMVGLVSMSIPLQTYAQASSAPASAASAKPLPVTTETQPGFTVVGLWVRTENKTEAEGNGQIPALWQRAMQEGLLEAVPHRADQDTVAVYTNYASDEKGPYTFVLGVRVTAVDKIPDGMMAVTIPAGKYAVVTSETGSLPDVMPKVWTRIWAMTPAEMGGERAFKADYEIYPEGFDWQNAQVEVHLGLK